MEHYSIDVKSIKLGMISSLGAFLCSGCNNPYILETTYKL